METRSLALSSISSFLEVTLKQIKLIILSLKCEIVPPKAISDLPQSDWSNSLRLECAVSAKLTLAKSLFSCSALR